MLEEYSILRILQCTKRGLEIKLQICHPLIQLERKVEGRECRQPSHQQELKVSMDAQG